MLGRVSIRTAVVGPVRSRMAPAIGLTIRPGATAANVIHPVSLGECNRANTNKFGVTIRENVISAGRESAVAAINSARCGIFQRAR